MSKIRFKLVPPEISSYFRVYCVLNEENNRVLGYVRRFLTGWEFRFPGDWEWHPHGYQCSTRKYAAELLVKKATVVERFLANGEK